MGCRGGEMNNLASKGLQALEILASVVSASVKETNGHTASKTKAGGKGAGNPSSSSSSKGPKIRDSEYHRVSCHRCGNIRKKKIVCSVVNCPHIFCGRCSDKYMDEYGSDVFDGGCPVCKELCCCSNKTMYCNR